MKERNIITKFSLLTICYIILIFLVKTCELILALLSETVIENFSGFIYGNLISALFVSFCIFSISFIISFCSKKVAISFAATLFTLMVFAEMGFIIYYKATGFLMGIELINRPLWEIVHTIKAFSNIWVLLFTLFLIALSIFLLLRISKKEFNVFYSKIITFLMIISVPLFFLLKPNQDKNIVNKTWYCLHSCLNDGSSKIRNIEYYLSKVLFNEEYTNQYKKLYPNREIINDYYPLERKDNIENVLGSYFKKKAIKPNIVFIIVESLGSDFFGENKYGYTMTPFLDSLSKHSLLWTNCLSTTPRSAGVVPAVTASVPHGSKGFQFGDIPECNSLFPILKENGYESNVFYACSFNFDRISDYLFSQEVDYISPFNRECIKSKEKDKFDYTSWGYHDKKMFERSRQIIGERTEESPNIDMFITISQHDNQLDLNSNKELENYYYKKAEDLLQSMPSEESKQLRKKKGFIATFLYGDDAIRDFFYSYTKKYDNTIFIITGDHSLNNNFNNPLDAFHVPLIIWSPFINKPQHFHSVVSHNDIAPSLTALLRDNFNLKTPQNVHWISDGLDTTKTFTSNAITYFLMQNNKSTNLLFDDLYYIENNDEQKLYKIKDNLDVEIFDNDSLLEVMKGRMEVMQYIDNYTYTNNCIISNPIIKKKKYELIDYIDIDSIFCASGKEKPSESGVESVDIFSKKVRSGYSEIKVIFTADLKYTADINHQDFMNMSVKCTNADWYPDVISKYITNKSYSPNEWVQLEFTKTFDIHNHKKKSKLYFFLVPPKHDGRWNPEHSVTLKNISIKIIGVKSE